MLNSTLNRVMAALGALSAATERRLIVTQPDFSTRSRGKGQGGANRLLALHRKIGLPKTQHNRRWHNPSDPVQAKRIAAAEAKRARKGRKLERDMGRCVRWNWAHMTGSAPTRTDMHSTYPVGLNPFYVNRGQEA